MTLTAVAGRESLDTDLGAAVPRYSSQRLVHGFSAGDRGHAECRRGAQYPSRKQRLPGLERDSESRGDAAEFPVPWEGMFYCRQKCCGRGAGKWEGIVRLVVDLL